METCPGERVMKEKKFTHTRKPYHKWVSGGLCNLRGEHNQKKRERKKQNICLTAITSREMAQMLTSIYQQQVEAGRRGAGYTIGP